MLPGTQINSSVWRMQVMSRTWFVYVLDWRFLVLGHVELWLVYSSNYGLSIVQSGPSRNLTLVVGVLWLVSGDCSQWMKLTRA